jgi:HAD superfamily hydrolase (TIGR01509 family)
LDGNIRELRGILFDWDGTIVDSAEAMWLSYRYSYRTHLGIEFPSNQEEFRILVPMRVSESAALYGGKLGPDIARAYTDYYEREAYKTGKVFSGMREVLAELRRRGYALGVASNKSWSRITADIEFLGLDGCVDRFVTAEDTVERKPHPAPLLKLAEKLDLPPAACTYIGDYRGDVAAAKAAGMLAVAVLWGGMFDPATLLAEEPDHVLAAPMEILDLFPSLTV